MAFTIEGLIVEFLMEEFDRCAIAEQPRAFLVMLEQNTTKYTGALDAIKSYYERTSVSDMRGTYRERTKQLLMHFVEDKEIRDRLYMYMNAIRIQRLTKAVRK